MQSLFANISNIKTLDFFLEDIDHTYINSKNPTSLKKIKVNQKKIRKSI